MGICVRALIQHTWDSGHSIPCLFSAQLSDIPLGAESEVELEVELELKIEVGVRVAVGCAEEETGAEEQTEHAFGLSGGTAGMGMEAESADGRAKAPPRRKKLIEGFMASASWTGDWRSRFESMGHYSLLLVLFMDPLKLR